MKREEAKVGMRVYETEFERKGTIVYKSSIDIRGCDVEFDNGNYDWIEYGKIQKLEEHESE